jgi:cell wall-associated NlpC family hydrolase
VRSFVRLFSAFFVLIALASSGLCLSVVLLAGQAGLGLATAGPSDLSTTAGASPAAAAALAWALAQLGTPYRWGGEGNGGFDCSGLVQAAYGAAGIHLPRVAQDQFDAGPHLAAGAPLQAGDLVFFGTSDLAVDHVGMVFGPGQMVDAPHTGAVVRVEPIFSEGYLGATRPAP